MIFGMVQWVARCVNVWGCQRRWGLVWAYPASRYPLSSRYSLKYVTPAIRPLYGDFHHSLNLHRVYICTRFASARCVLYPYISPTITYLHQLFYLYLFVMFSPLVTAEFPTYDEAFAYTKSYAIENGIDLTKKRTNYREKGGLVRN